jgi:DNA-binding HxlR family transcriptional regulator
MEFRSNCPLNIFLDIVGDKWSLLIIRDIFMGANTYSQFLKSPEKIASNILVDRLKKLKSYGILNIVRDKEDTKIKHYYLTEKGIDLYPILAEMMDWSQKHVRLNFHPLSEEILHEIKQIGVTKHTESYSKNYRHKLENILGD